MKSKNINNLDQVVKILFEISRFSQQKLKND